MNRRPTRRELARQRSQEVFAGRQQALDNFRRNLERPPESDGRKLIWMVCGEGGIGKTTLLRRYRTIVTEMKYATAWVDEFTSPSVLGVMSALADELEKQGHSLKAFADRYKTYRQRKNEIDTDPERPKGFAAAVGKAGGRIGVEFIKQVPVAGGLAMGLVGEEFIVEKSTEFADFVARKLGSKDEARLVLEPLEVLTPLFVESLSNIADRTSVALFFDTYEKTVDYLDAWLRDLLEGKYGDLALDVLLVMAGRYELGQGWMSEVIEPFLETIRLEPFTEAEAREYLTKQNITDEIAIEIILKLSGRVPVMLTTLANRVPDDPDQLGDPTGEAIDRFLKWVGEEAQRQAVLACALPRALNLDVVTVLLGEEQSAPMFDFVRSMSFVSQKVESGWAYHDVVRKLMLRQRRQESRRRWQEMHTKLADYYAAERDSLNLELKDGLRDERWQHYNLEWLYHTICAKGRGATDGWINCMLDTFDPGSPPEYDKSLGETVLAAGESLEEADIITWGQKIIDGMEAWNSSEYEQSIPMLDAVIDNIKSFPTEKQALAFWARGRMHYWSNNYPAALADFSRAIELQPEDGNNYNWRGTTHYQMKDYPAALTDLNHAIELQPEDSINYYWRGFTHRELQDYPSALEDFSRAIEFQPEDGYNYYWRGMTHYDLKDYPAALPDFNRAIELQPKAGYNYVLRGLTYYELKNYSAALIDFDHLIELQPEDGSNYYWRGTMHYELQNYPSALENFSRAIELQPENGGHYYWHGRTHYQQKNYPAALTDFSKAIELQPENSNYYYSRGFLHRELQNYAAALTDFSRAVEHRPEDGDNYFWRGRTFRDLQDYPAALADFNRAIELQPKDGYNYNWRGTTYYQMKEDEAAIVDFSRAIELQPEESDNYYWRARTRYQQKNYLMALTDINIAIELQPEDSVNTYFRALIYLQNGDYASAMQDLNRSIELAPQSPHDVFWRGVTQQMLGEDPQPDWLQAETLAQAEQKDICLQQRVLAKLALMRGQNDAARDHYQQALQANCEPSNLDMEVSYLELLVKLYPDRADIAETAAWFEKQL